MTQIPFEIINRSNYNDESIYIAVVGITDGHVWLDCKSGIIHEMSSDDNTIRGPVYNGNLGPKNDGLYANCFSRLSEIPGRRLSIPRIQGCRIFISFEAPLSLYFFAHQGSPSGYAAPNLQNPSDPNYGIRFEVIELTNADNGLWVNTTRVDSYQYPMALEVWGSDEFHQAVGEMTTHDEITARWRSDVLPEFKNCLNGPNGIIHYPSKIPDFQAEGMYADYFKEYVEAIWSKFIHDELVFESDAGIWNGRVEGGRFLALLNF